jgi:triacylglycerol esterase/lipase EstA (alpha/beta hydrolase family)
MKLTARQITSLLAVCGWIGVSAAPAAAVPSPYAVPGVSPAGANDWHCRPSARHPVPVVLVHGTFQDMTLSWSYISPRLAQDGYCVFALDFGRRGTAPIERSALQVSRFIERVLKTTHTARVSIVGHSQGGLLARYYIRFLGGRRTVDDLVGIAPPNHGLNPGPIFTPYLQRRRSRCTTGTTSAAGMRAGRVHRTGGQLAIPAEAQPRRPDARSHLVHHDRNARR